MFGMLFGTLCLLGLVKVARGGPGFQHGGCHGGYHARWGHGGWEGRRGRRGRGDDTVRSEGFARAAGEMFKRRFDVDEEQEGIVDQALDDARTAVKEFTEEVKDTRKPLGDAFRGETVDDAAIATLFARHDDALGRLRRQLLSAAKQVHAVFDADQRKKAADAISSSEPRWI